MTAGTDYSVRRTENRHVLPSYLQGWGILQENLVLEQNILFLRTFARVLIFLASKITFNIVEYSDCLSY